MMDIASEIADITFQSGSSANLLYNGEAAKVYATRRGEAVAVVNVYTLRDALREYDEKANEFINDALGAEMRKLITHEEMAAAALRMLESLSLAIRSFEEKLDKEREILMSR